MVARPPLFDWHSASGETFTTAADRSPFTPRPRQPRRRASPMQPGELDDDIADLAKESSE